MQKCKNLFKLQTENISFATLPATQCLQVKNLYCKTHFSYRLIFLESKYRVFKQSKVGEQDNDPQTIAPQHICPPDICPQDNYPWIITKKNCLPGNCPLHQIISSWTISAQIISLQNNWPLIITHKQLSPGKLPMAFT